MTKIVIASDSFKGSLSSYEIAVCAEKAVFSVFPDCKVVKIPVADGGEGTVEAMVTALNGRFITCEVNGPLMKLVRATYGISTDGITAIIEMSAASGLTLLAESERNPMLTTTYGTGELIKDALLRGCKNFLIGIGGSATNDGGAGMLQALGFRFLDKNGKELGTGGKILSLIHSIDDTEVLPAVKEATFTIASDVINPFYGKNGAAHVFGPQKGADDKTVQELDEGLRSFASVIRESGRKPIDQLPGAGAAGGLGGAFIAFLNAQLKSGVEMILETINFSDKIKDADLIITGEGKLDKQTIMGKTPLGVLREAQRQQTPVIAIGGYVEEFTVLNEAGFLSVLPVLPFPVSLAKAMEKEFTGQNIIHTLEQYLRGMRYFIERNNINKKLL